ncbi:MAG: hypothetical protein ACFCUR_09205 [Rhodomicrobiaceae bacterium]
MRVSSFLKTVAAGFAAALLIPAAASQAGDRNCTGNCYEEVPAPSYHQTLKRRVTLQRGAYEIDREPSLYGSATKRVLVDDGVEWHEEPAVYKTVKVRKRLKSRTTWEKRWVDGRHIMCEVKVPGKTVWVNKKVLVKPARRWKTRSAPTYKYVQKRILLRPYKNIAVYHKARHKYVRERVEIQPEATVWQPVGKSFGKDW